MPLVKTSGIVLNSRPMGELDRIVEIFSEDIGRIQGIAKGARSFKNRFGGSLEPFTYCRLNLFKKNNNTLHRIESADIIASFRTLREDLSLLLHASCMVDTLRKLVPLEDPNRVILSLLHNSLDRLAAGDPAEKILSYYQIRLLHISGVGPRLDSCLKCSREIKYTRVIISVSEGGSICPSCSSRLSGKYTVVTGATMAVIRKWQSTPMYHVNRFIIADDIKREMKELLEAYITYVTGKKIMNVDAYLS